MATMEWMEEDSDSSELEEDSDSSELEEDSDSSEDEESLEYQSLCKHSGELSSAIRRNPEKFAEDLFAKHIISDRLLGDIRKRRRGKRRVDPYSDKTKKLLDVVKNVIKTDPGKLKVLLEVVNQCSPSVAKKLQHSCGMFCCMMYRVHTKCPPSCIETLVLVHFCRSGMAPPIQLGNYMCTARMGCLHAIFSIGGIRSSELIIARNFNSAVVRTLISVAYRVISKMRKFTLYCICN